MDLDVKETAKLLLSWDNIVILCHRSPDGDTVGSAMGLYYALKKCGKSTTVKCIDVLPEKFAYIYPEEFPEISHDFVVAIDVATHAMLGGYAEIYPKIDLCIDHHISNSHYSNNLCIEETSPATGQIMLEIIENMNIEIDQMISNCIYTAIVSDTGGFRYPGTDSKTFFATARLLEYGAKNIMINRLIFETKSKGLVEVEAKVSSEIQYHFNDIVAIMTIPWSIVEKSGVKDDELDSIASLPRNILDVGIGITIKQKSDGECRISFRSVEPYNAAKIAANFGGGGHINAAGCRIIGKSLAEVVEMILDIVSQEISL